MSPKERPPDSNEVFKAIIEGSYTSDERARLVVESERTKAEIDYDNELAERFEASRRSWEYLHRKGRHMGLGRAGLRGFLKKLKRPS